MATFDIVMPKLGESVQEATITKWFKQAGDKIAEEESLLEIATDKVDSEIPSPVDGIIVKILFEVNALVPVGEIIAVVDTSGTLPAAEPIKKKTENGRVDEPAVTIKKPVQSGENYNLSGKFFSPLVKNIASGEGIKPAELENIKGTGHKGRVKKEDLLNYLENRESKTVSEKTAVSVTAPKSQPAIPVYEGDTIIKMDRMRKLIAENMVMSKQISPHVTSFIEADVTNLVFWRNKVKEEFEAREKQKLTFMPVFIEAAARSLKEFPGINASVDGENIILRKNVNIGIAVALPSGNLIVPVIRNADQKTIVGLTHDMNSLAENARKNRLSPDDIQGGTFTISNFGSFRNLTGTPIINQPQVAILATGTIEKKPAVLETPTGDVIAIRHIMILALTYDHRIVDGALAGRFLRSMADYLENLDINRKV
jgi:2-oxoglutarate dehydrogenase E2 component (dihydrolipoamide succinyltransferase)